MFLGAPRDALKACDGAGVDRLVEVRRHREVVTKLRPTSPLRTEDHAVDESVGAAPTEGPDPIGLSSVVDFLEMFERPTVIFESHVPAPIVVQSQGT